MSSDIPSTAVRGRGSMLPVVTVLVALGVLVLAFVASNCIRRGPGNTFTAPVSQFQLDTPVYLSGKKLYIVRTGGGQVFAFDENVAERRDYTNGCLIRYRENLAGGGRTGVFRHSCAGTLYDLTGMVIEGDGPPLKRHPATIKDDTLTVDTATCVEGDSGRTVACKPL